MTGQKIWPISMKTLVLPSTSMWFSTGPNCRRSRASARNATVSKVPTLDGGRLPDRSCGTHPKKELRIIYYIGISAIAILEVFAKTTRTTPQPVLDQAKKRLRQYRALAEGSDL